MDAIPVLRRGEGEGGDSHLDKYGGELAFLPSRSRKRIFLGFPSFSTNSRRHKPEGEKILLIRAPTKRKGEKK